MRIGVLVNPVAGRGRARRAAAELMASLRRGGHETEPIETWRGAPNGLEARLAGVDLLVVAGGDGAVRFAAGAAAATQTPVWQWPLGTENLFARQWGMHRRVWLLVDAIERGATATIDLGMAEGEPFVLMASAGYDADVVHELARRRGAGIGHLSYLRPILSRLWHARPPRLRVEVDGVLIGGDGPCLALVGNSSRYAMGLDPAPQARMDDGLLDVARFPLGRAGVDRATGRGALRLAGWVLRCALRRQTGHPELAQAKGREIVFEADEPFRYQLDGDPPWDRAKAPGVRRLRISVRPACLRVLLPLTWQASTHERR